MAGTARGKQTRAWQRMLSGRRLDLLDPTPMDIEIEDIAHGLAFVARWNGQTRGDFAYSVAEHSLLVERIFDRQNPGIAPRWKLAALLHDAPEYVIGDMISPFKAALGVDYKTFEAKLETAIHVRFGLPALTPEPVKQLIKAADRCSAYFEATQLAGFGEDEAKLLFGAPPDDWRITLHPLPAAEAQVRFVQRFHTLAEAAGAETPAAPAAFDTE